jgi:hypothetical protein
MVLVLTKEQRSRRWHGSYAEQESHKDAEGKDLNIELGFTPDKPEVAEKKPAAKRGRKKATSE